jgi:hypothetical protein
MKIRGPRGQEDGRADEVARLAPAAGRRLAADLLAQGGVRQLAGHGRREPARQDGVDLDPVRRQLPPPLPA